IRISRITIGFVSLRQRAMPPRLGSTRPHGAGPQRVVGGDLRWWVRVRRASAFHDVGFSFRWRIVVIGVRIESVLLWYIIVELARIVHRKRAVRTDSRKK